MASGGSPWRGYALAAIVLIVVLATTHVWNPWPQVWAWINTSEPIAAGVSQWQTRIGGSPQNVLDGGPGNNVVIPGGPTHAPASTAALAANVTVLSQFMASSLVTAGDGHGGMQLAEQPANQPPLLAQPHA